ncbi:transcription initiation factor TFIID subunit 4-like [Sarcophilus harrisii]|uniref:transcription initiation factor TFIID subunit 4-like n=1 Tax=Sarcophilus harrisii TaxID=9305 RepID=UPI001301ADBA|nr:transcription initiation factor TFIID subunit 4-like [Sarcophilus harrisii]
MTRLRSSSRLLRGASDLGPSAANSISFRFGAQVLPPPLGRRGKQSLRPSRPGRLPPKVTMTNGAAGPRAPGVGPRTGQAQPRNRLGLGVLPAPGPLWGEVARPFPGPAPRRPRALQCHPEQGGPAASRPPFPRAPGQDGAGSSAAFPPDSGGPARGAPAAALPAPRAAAAAAAARRRPPHRSSARPEEGGRNAAQTLGMREDPALQAPPTTREGRCREERLRGSFTTGAALRQVPPEASGSFRPPELPAVS